MEVLIPAIIMTSILEILFVLNMVRVSKKKEIFCITNISLLKNKFFSYAKKSEFKSIFWTELIFQSIVASLILFAVILSIIK